MRTIFNILLSCIILFSCKEESSLQLRRYCDGKPTTRVSIFDVSSDAKGTYYKGREGFIINCISDEVYLNDSKRNKTKTINYGEFRIQNGEEIKLFLRPILENPHDNDYYIFSDKLGLIMISNETAGCVLKIESLGDVYNDLIINEFKHYQDSINELRIKDNR